MSVAPIFGRSMSGTRIVHAIVSVGWPDSTDWVATRAACKGMTSPGAQSIASLLPLAEVEAQMVRQAEWSPWSREKRVCAACKRTLQQIAEDRAAAEKAKVQP